MSTGSARSSHRLLTHSCQLLWHVSNGLEGLLAPARFPCTGISTLTTSDQHMSAYRSSHYETQGLNSGVRYRHLKRHGDHCSPPMITMLELFLFLIHKADLTDWPNKLRDLTNFSIRKQRIYDHCRRHCLRLRCVHIVGRHNEKYTCIVRSICISALENDTQVYWCTAMVSQILQASAKGNLSHTLFKLLLDSSNP